MTFRRSLESHEADIARQVFGDALDVSALNLAEGGLLPTAMAGFFAKGLYDYGGADGPRGKTFADFNTEQQANIVADYYYLSTYEPHRDLSAYSPYIAHVRSGA